MLSSAKRKLSETSVENNKPMAKKVNIGGPLFRINPKLSKLFSDFELDSSSINAESIRKLYIFIHFGQSDTLFRWYDIHYKNKLSQVVLITVEKFPVEYFVETFNHLDFIKNNFTDYVQFESPLKNNSTFYEEFSKQKNSSKDTKANETTSFSCLNLLLNASQMMNENYPILEDGYVYSKEKYLPVTESSPLYALDCEMCETVIGSEVTKISIIDSECNTIYNTLVKPPREIKDYKTKYSGITKDILDPVTTTLEEVHTFIRDTLPADAILCGQSLNFDFHALKMIHPYVIDTSVIFNTSGYPNNKEKLKVLSRVFLKLNIQDNKNGHDPTEDCIAAMKLVNLKLKKGLDFGDAVRTKMVNKQIINKNFFQVVNNEKHGVMYFGRQDFACFPAQMERSIKSKNKSVAKAAIRRVLEKKYNFINFSLDLQQTENAKLIDKHIENIYNHCYGITAFFVLFTGTEKQNGLFLGKVKV